MRKYKIPWLRLTGLVLLGILLWQLDIATLSRIIQDADWRLLSIAAVLNFPMVLLKALRWRTLMLSQRIRYPLGQAYLAYFGSIFIGLLTPGRLGEFVKVTHINRDCKVPLGRAFSTVLVDRLFDLYALLTVGGLAMLSLSANQGKGAIWAIALMMLLLASPFLILLNENAFAWVRAIGSRWKKLERLFAPQSWLLELRSGLQQLSIIYLLASMGLTSLAYAIFFGQCYLLAMALGVDANFGVVSSSVAIGSLVTLLPISISGLGTREAAIATYLSTSGVPAETALAFSLLVFATFYIIGGLIGGVAWWLKPAPLQRS